MSHDQHARMGEAMANNLREYIWHIRAAIDRGLPITANMVLDGLEIAVDERRRPDLPMRYDIGLQIIEDRARRIQEDDRRFGQPNFGHYIEEER